jgi:vancomycin resistance protein YoaR
MRAAGARSSGGDAAERDQRGSGGLAALLSRFSLDQRRLTYLLAAAPVVFVVLVVIAWTIDSSVMSGQVVRNTDLAGHSIDGRSEGSLPAVVSDVAEEVASRPVTLQVHPPAPQAGRSAGLQERSYTATAEELGLSIDQEATIEAALDVGRESAFFLRPFQWLRSFFGSHDAPLVYNVDELQTFTKLQELQGTDLTLAVEPTIQLQGPQFVAVPGRAGLGIDTDDVVAALPDAAEAVEGADADEPMVIDVGVTDLRPQFTEEEAQALAERANTMTAQGLALQADTNTVNVPPEQLRTWIMPTITENGLSLMLNEEVTTAALPTLFSNFGAPVDAKVELQGGAPVVVPAQNGITCCAESATTLIWDALDAGQPSAVLEVTVTEPELTTAEVEAWGITQPIGGNRGWRNGGSIEGPAPGFTTYHDCCLARVTNIHRIAEIVRGAVIPPGGTFSVNDHVGRRTEAGGFVPAGAIREGAHVDEVGGGVSQFATTLFNAAYFAGLDIVEYQAHSEYFPRYPRGREATMGYPAPDLEFVNNTPYGVLIDTSFTGSSLTVTMWSTPHATAEQTGISERAQGVCTVVTTTRTRTFPDGSTDNDTFAATYRPEGFFCDGSPVTTTTTTLPGTPPPPGAPPPGG